jgi:hypothetical protein
MTRLDDAWKWYTDAKAHLQAMRRLADNHWNQLPADKLLNASTQEQVVEDTTAVLGNLDDLAVVVLFSVFEATIRQKVCDDLRAEREGLKNPVLKAAAKEAVERIEVGSFARVLEPYKTTPESKELIEQVNQVRKYRNWVAHGRRDGWESEFVNPRDAFDRLGQFLVALDTTDPGTEE